jgi:DNA invertase Pin-like site-specific DNA recombinase
LEAQAEQIRAYALAHGFTLSHIYVDAGVSGGTPLAERPQGALLLAAIDRKTVAHVVTLKLDRLFRNTVDCLDTVQRRDRTKVGPHLIDFNGAAIDTRSAIGRFFLTMAAGFSEMERALIGERTATALQHKKANGVRLGGVPFGFKSDRPGAPLQPNREELVAVRLILRLRKKESNDSSYRRIATTLNASAYPTRTGAARQAETVRKIVARRGVYEGVL